MIVNMGKIGAEVKQLYERFPYPSRSHVGTRELEKYLKWVLPAFGEKELSFFSWKKILDAGCGTGEFATALALHGATVKGIDFSSASIAKARAFAKKMRAKNIEFERANLFDFSPKERFDIVFSLGVLHHTASAKKSFEKIVSFCRPGGFACIGLYNKFGRMRHRLKRVLLKAVAGSNVEKRMELAKKLFPEARNNDVAWLADKFGQLHESYHSVSEVLKWFEENNLVFVGSRPELKANGSALLLQLNWLLEQKGAFFVVAGKKN